MVVGNEFVWMRFPKTAGHTVELALRAATRGRREMIQDGEFFEQSGAVSKADVHATLFADGSVHRRLRTEHLLEDFVACFGDILGPAAVKACRKLDRKVNETRLRHVERLDFHFTRDELRRLYEANPIWAAVEREVYGGLLGD